jgi:hypothetical protein
LTFNFAESVFAYDNDSNTCGGEVLLSAGVDSVVFSDVNWAREDIRAHVGNETSFNIGVFTDFGTVDSIVRGVVEVVHVSRNNEVFGNECVVSVFRRSDNINVTEKASFFDSVRRPSTGVEVSSLVAEEVERNHAELGRSTTTKPEDRVSFGNFEEFFNERSSFVDDSLEFFAAVRNFEDRETGISEVKNSVSSILNCVFT